MRITIINIALAFPLPVSAYFHNYSCCRRARLDKKNDPLNTHSGQKRPGGYDEILKAKATLGKFLKEKYYSEHFPTFCFKYFAKLLLFLKLLSEVLKNQTSISGGIFKHYWVNPFMSRVQHIFTKYQSSFGLISHQHRYHIVLANRAPGCLLDTQTPQNHPSGHPNILGSNFIKCQF